MKQAQLFATPKAKEEPAPKVRYRFREQYYPEPPEDWPAPKEPCWQCKRFPQELQAGWRWNGYYWECARRHDE